MTDNLPPLPELPPPEVEEWSETFITLRGEGWKKETVEKYATDYARAAIERQSVPQPQPVQEPVAWYDGKNFYENPESASMCMAEMTNLHPLYTSPQIQGEKQ